MEEFESDHCPVCHKPVVVAPDTEISEQQREIYGNEIYIPGDVIDEVELTDEQKAQREDLLKFLDATRPEEVKLEE